MAEKVEDVTPRLEFRAFAVHFGNVVDEIRRQAACTGIAETRDIYLITAVNDTHNIKIRDNQLDVKKLMATEDGLERWKPQFKLDFPAAARDLRTEIFPALQVAVPSLPEGEVAQETFLDEVLWPHPEVRLAQVFKRRFFFTVADCQVEITELRVNGAALQTIALEDEQDTAVLNARKMLGLTAYENVNYLLALKRIMGMAPLPEPQWQMNGEDSNG